MSVFSYPLCVTLQQFSNDKKFICIPLGNSMVWKLLLFSLVMKTSKLYSNHWKYLITINYLYFDRKAFPVAIIFKTLSSVFVNFSERNRFWSFVLSVEWNVCTFPNLTNAGDFNRTHLMLRLAKVIKHQIWSQTRQSWTCFVFNEIQLIVATLPWRIVIIDLPKQRKINLLTLILNSTKTHQVPMAKVTHHPCPCLLLSWWLTTDIFSDDRVSPHGDTIRKSFVKLCSIVSPEVSSSASARA